jgi:hypothetical protein
MSAGHKNTTGSSGSLRQRAAKGTAAEEPGAKQEPAAGAAAAGGTEAAAPGSAAAAAAAAAAEYSGQFRRRPSQANTPQDDCILCIVIAVAVAIVVCRFVYLFHDRVRIMAGGEDNGGAGCYKMMGHACTFETEVCCPEGCAAAGGLWVDGEVRTL